MTTSHTAFIPCAVLIIGAGLMGRWHAAAAAHAGHRIVAIVDADVRAAARLARLYNAAIFASVDLVPPTLVSVAHISTPPETHADLIRAALDRGWHVISEKPLAMTADETTALYDFAHQRALRLMPVHQMPFQDGARHALESLSAVGQLIRIDARFYSAGAASRGDADTIAANILAHPLSLIYPMLTAVRTVPRDPAALQSASELDKHASLFWHVLRPLSGDLHALTMREGIAITIHISMSARPTRAALEVVGSRGIIVLDLYHGYSVRLPGAVSRWHKIAAPFDHTSRISTSAWVNLARRAAQGEWAFPGLRRLIAAFYDALRAGGDLPITRAETEWIAIQRDAILHSSTL